MVLQSCPECAAQVSSLAASCPSCGCPVSAVGKPKRSKPAGHIGTVPGCFLILLACVVIAIIGTPDQSPPVDRSQRTAPARKPTPPAPPAQEEEERTKWDDLLDQRRAEREMYQDYLRGMEVLDAATAPRR
jgi:hypothetical protein